MLNIIATVTFFEQTKKKKQKIHQNSEQISKHGKIDMNQPSINQPGLKAENSKLSNAPRSTLEDFDCIKKIGTGSYSTVWKAIRK